jgi:hypothetical protein
MKLKYQKHEIAGQGETQYKTDIRRFEGLKSEQMDDFPSTDGVDWTGYNIRLKWFCAHLRVADALRGLPPKISWYRAVRRSLFFVAADVVLQFPQRSMHLSEQGRLQWYPQSPSLQVDSSQVR